MDIDKEKFLLKTFEADRNGTFVSRNTSKAGKYTVFAKFRKGVGQFRVDEDDHVLTHHKFLSYCDKLLVWIMI